MFRRYGHVIGLGVIDLALYSRIKVFTSLVWIGQYVPGTLDFAQEAP